MTTSLDHPGNRLHDAASPATAPGPDPRRSGLRLLTADLLTALAWALVAVPVALWLAAGGLATAVATPAGLVTGAGILAGLVGTALLVLMLLLAARIPLVDRTIGHDRAIAVHSSLGQWTFGALVTHGLFIVTGYSLADGTGPVAEVASLLGIGDVAWAAVSLAALTAVAVTSIAAARRALPYEAWQGIHLLSYAAFALAIPHQFSLGGLFDDGPAFWYWSGLFTLTAFALLTFRVFLPLFSSLTHRLVVSRVIRESPDTVSIELTGRDLPGLGAEAGQFFHWRFLAPGLWWHQHPFSLSAAPTADTLRITVRDLGRGSAALANVRPGTPVAFEGPYGVFTDRARTAADVVLVGIGVGIAPVRSLLEGTSFAPGHGTVILRASTPELVLLRGEIEALCQARGARLVILTGPRAVGADGRPQWVPYALAGLHLADLVPGIADADVYVCGPQGAADLVLADAAASGTPHHRLHNERFSW